MALEGKGFRRRLDPDAPAYAAQLARKGLLLFPLAQVFDNAVRMRNVEASVRQIHGGPIAAKQPAAAKVRGWLVLGEVKAGDVQREVPILPVGGAAADIQDGPSFPRR